MLLPSQKPEPSANLPRWLSVHQIQKMQRMSRRRVLIAMDRGHLPFEQRGRVRYARLIDIIAWEEKRLKGEITTTDSNIHPDLNDLT